MGYSTYLCYSKERGLFIKYYTRGSDNDIVLFRSHDEQWKRTLVAKVPDSDINITIKTKIGSKFYSFYYATIYKGDRIILDFDKTKLNILNKSGVERHSVDLGDWNGLFSKIIHAINSSEDDTCPESAIDYIDGIRQIIRQDSISIKGQYCDRNLYTWDGKYLVLLYAAGKLKNLLNWITEARITDKLFHSSCLALCHDFLNELSANAFDLCDKRTEQLSDTLLDVHNYMYQHGSGVEFLEYFQNKN